MYKCKDISLCVYTCINQNIFLTPAFLYFSFTQWRKGLFLCVFTVIRSHFILTVNDNLPYCCFLVFKICWISCRRQIRKHFWLLILQQENRKIKWLAIGILDFLLDEGCSLNFIGMRWCLCYDSYENVQLFIKK